MTTTPQPQVDIDELERELADAVIGGKDRVSLPRAEFAALIAETRALRAVKLRVHELAATQLSCASKTGPTRELLQIKGEIERITR